MPSTEYLSLPLELLLEILAYLDARSLLRCSAVCRFLREMIKSTIELQYKIELAADGVVDGPPGPMSTAERLNLLLDRRRRWRTLDWVDKLMIPIPGACQAYELVAGVFAKSMGHTHAHGSHHLIATWLPSRTEGTRRVIRENLGVSTRDFAIDPSQDLIALVDAGETPAEERQVQVHLRTISTNAKHPRAAAPMLSCRVSFDFGSSFIQIVDDVIGMFFWTSGPGLIIWNWMSNEILVYCVSNQLPLGTWDFGFLSSRAFLLTTTANSGAIELFSFGGRAPPFPHMQHEPTHVASLSLPALQDRREPMHFSTHWGPFVNQPIQGKPFETARDSRVHLMSLLYGDRGPRYHLFLHNKFLLSFFAREDEVSEAKPKVTREWHEWGPPNTRFLEHNVNFQWLRYVHGQRVVLPPFSLTWPAAQSTLCVIDFNVHPKRIDDPVPLTFDQNAGSRFQINLDPSVVEAGSIFQHDVVTSLPYSVSSRSGSFNYSGFMIDDERIVGMKSMAFADGNISDVDVYTF